MSIGRMRTNYNETKEEGNLERWTKIDREREALNLETQTTTKKRQPTIKTHTKKHIKVSSSDESDMEVKRRHRI